MEEPCPGAGVVCRRTVSEAHLRDVGLWRGEPCGVTVVAWRWCAMSTDTGGPMESQPRTHLEVESRVLEPERHPDGHQLEPVLQNEVAIVIAAQRRKPCATGLAP